MSDSLWPHGPQHARLPCPSPTPRVHSTSCPLSWWCHPTISSSVAPFSSCPWSFPASGSFPMSQVFESSGQSIGASASVFPMNIQGWFPLGWTGFDLLAPEDSQESSPTPQFKSTNSLALSLVYVPALTSVHDRWKNRSFDYWTHTHTSTPFWIFSPCKPLPSTEWGSRCCGRSWSAHLFCMWWPVHVSPKLQCVLPPSHHTPVTRGLFSTSVTLFLFCK